MHLFREDVDAAEIVRRASESQAASAAAKNVTLQMNIAADGPRLSGDKARLEQVVWNLVNNALKFTPSGGLVMVSLDFEPSAVRIVVADNGVGIAPDKLPHVFERLRQGDSSSTRSFGGLGLGLAIVSHLVDRHGGAARAESEGLGKGAVFTVTLPYNL
jgi:signal transduction histidine kinase